MIGVPVQSLAGLEALGPAQKGDHGQVPFWKGETRAKFLGGLVSLASRWVGRVVLQECNGAPNIFPEFLALAA